MSAPDYKPYIVKTFLKAGGAIVAAAVLFGAALGVWQDTRRERRARNAEAPTHINKVSTHGQRFFVQLTPRFGRVVDLGAKTMSSVTINKNGDTVHFNTRSFDVIKDSASLATIAAAKKHLKAGN